MRTKKVYFIRHQAEGILTDRVFLTPPTAADMKAARERMRKKHGDGHPKYNDRAHPHYAGDDHPSRGAKWWLAIEETCLLVPDGASLDAIDDAKLPSDPVEVGADGRPKGEVKAETPLVASKGEGRVLAPGEPGYEEALAEMNERAKARG